MHIAIGVILLIKYTENIQYQYANIGLLKSKYAKLMIKETCTVYSERLWHLILIWKIVLV